MKRYINLLGAAGYWVALLCAGGFLGMVSYIVWDQMLGLDGQRFVSVVAVDFVAPFALVVGGVLVVAIAYATYRDHKKGAL